MSKSGWTIDTVLAHLLALRGADSKAVEAALAASQKAVDTAMASAEKATNVQEVTNLRWREAANEWRGAMDDRDRKAADALQKYAQKSEVDIVCASMDEKITGLTTEIRTLQAASFATAGRSAGVNAAWGYLAGAVGVAAAVAALLSR